MLLLKAFRTKKSINSQNFIFWGRECSGVMGVMGPVQNSLDKHTCRLMMVSFNCGGGRGGALILMVHTRLQHLLL